MNSLFDFEYSPWFVILCLALGIGYSYIQYQKKTPWSSQLNMVLAAARAVFVSLLFILILGPTMWAIKNFYEKPLLVMAIDNSESIALTADSTALQNMIDDLNAVRAVLNTNGWEVKLLDLDGEKLNLDSLNFIKPRTNLTGMVRTAQSEYEGSNLAGVLVVSDGIFNTGFSPDFISTFTPIYGLGIGDTIPRKDLSIIDVRHNKTVYQDNKFPVEVSIRNEGLGPASTQLKVYQNNKLIDQTKIDVSPDTRLIQHQFTISADEAGKQRISIVLSSLPGEYTDVNNRANFYIDVIEGQQKVLIIADAPSPDIKAIRLAIEKNEHFLVDVNVGEAISTLDYDLIILNQLPGRTGNRQKYQQIIEAEVPKLFIVGSATNIRQLNNDGVLNFSRSNNQSDQVTADLSPEFNSFTFVNDIEELLDDVPPVSVPFGEIDIQPVDEVLLYQRVGSVMTAKPLIYFSDAEIKQGVIIGDGFWKWRLNEYQKYSESARFDELITKIVMYLASKPDNRQFKMYPVKDNYEFGDNIQFIAETYNELFEPIFGERVSLTITSEEFSKEYSFTPLEGSREINIDNLPEGIYQYAARTNLNGQSHQVRGQFTIENPNLEAADLTADFTVLRKLANESEGQFYTGNQLDKLKSDFEQIEAPTIIHTQKKELLLLNLPWILAILILLITGEWLTRKIMGGY